MLVEEKVKGQLLTSTLFNEIISLNCERLSEEEIDLLLGDDKNRGKLTDHPIISKDQNTGLWNFKHEQIEFNLIAELVLDYIMQNNLNALKNFFKNIVVKGSILDDLTIVLIERLNTNGDKDSKLITLLTNFKSCITKENQKPRTVNNLSIVLTKIVISHLNKVCPIGSTSKEIRTKELLDLIGESQINDYHFTGTLASIDFSNITFQNCVFENIVWANCRFNETTVFNNCSFIGGEIHNSNGFGNSNFMRDCEFDKFAEISVNYERIRQGSKKIDSDDIQRDIILFIRKFVPRDGVFKNVYDDGLLKGHLAILPYKNDLMQIMKKYIIDENLDDSGHFYKIKSTARDSINYYFNNGLFSGDLAKAYNELLRKFK